jgi:hypothetical protein
MMVPGSGMAGMAGTSCSQPSWKKAKGGSAYALRLRPAGHSHPIKRQKNSNIRRAPDCRAENKIFLLLLLSYKPFDMSILRQIAEYLYIKKRDPNAPHTPWMKYMHGINRISIFMFLVALIIIIVRLVFLRHR